MAMDNWIWFNRAGSAGTYTDSGTAFIPAVVLGAALDGLIAIPRASETVQFFTGLYVKKDADNWQLWRASFAYSNAVEDEWYQHDILESAGALTEGDAVEVRAVPIAEMLSQMVTRMDRDAHYPIKVDATTFEVTKEHANKMVVCTHASGCTVTFDRNYWERALCVHFLQLGGQITLAADAAMSFNGAGTSVAHAITDAARKRSSVYKDGVSSNTYTVVQE